MSRRFLKQAGVVILFALFVDIFGLIQFELILQIPSEPKFFIVPTFIGSVFGSILVFTHHYYHRAKDKERFEMLAKTDRLTGILSRYSFDMLYEMEFERFKRTKHPFSLLMFDLDDFKKVNDVYGHTTGDRVLKELCDVIQKELRSIDLFCRWGGEEFVIILPETPKKEIKGIGERLRMAVEKHDFGINRAVTISLGGIEVNEETGWESHQYLYKMDESLYRSKEEGKNRLILCCDPQD